MSARKEPKGRAFLIPLEKYVNSRGEERTRGVVGGETDEARDELVNYLQEHADARLETPEETARARMFSGFGEGKMDASQGRRTKIVLKRRGGASSTAV